MVSEHLVCVVSGHSALSYGERQAVAGRLKQTGNSRQTQIADSSRHRRQAVAGRQ